MRNRSRGTRSAGWTRLLALASGICLVPAALSGCAPAGSDSQPAAAPGQHAVAELPEPAALLTAGTRAQAEVPGAVLTAIELAGQGSRWEVTLTTPAGVETELGISVDGAELLAGPREEADDEADRATHRDRVLAATIGYDDALRTVLREHDGARITEIALDEEHGRVLWEVDLVDASGAASELSVDAGTGNCWPAKGPSVLGPLAQSARTAASPDKNGLRCARNRGSQTYT